MAFGDSYFAHYQYIGVITMAWIFPACADEQHADRFGTALTIIILTSIL